MQVVYSDIFFTSATSFTNWIGEIFLRSLNMVIVPLIFFSISTGVASVGSIGLVLAVDRILDMFRTTINVYGDTYAGVIIAKSEGEKLKI